ncbi:Receptor-like serine/threonine-protein kinase [Heracleum sosnowskyi]|uniref:non-specific serine/threonine protein kinase n=1 Tax=Heracleum sosnowskyi TaxID=360622 RepID=A0AAD8JP10_9APIA|nr:Receptor-like serine/threonine-protein kinase [Heracleum sosnowskyi]
MKLQTKKTTLCLLALHICALFCETRVCEGTHVISVSQSLSGNQTIFSENGTFELGFFTPGKSKNYYIGIWYKNFVDKTVVWVANRNHPVTNPYDSELKLLPDGNLALLNESKIQIWSSNSTARKDNSTLAILFDNGNFVTRDNQDSSNIIWQSFDDPTDTWLPGGKIGYNKIKKEKIYLTSWRNSENPAPSLFSLEVETNGTSIILLYNRTKQYLSTGAWTGRYFVLVPEIERNPYISNFRYVSNVNESKLTYDTATKTLTRFMIDVTGQFRQFAWRENFPERRWGPNWMRPEQCEVPKFCGAFGTCNQLKAPPCTCLQGYEPRVSKNWALGDYTDGCIRKSPLHCGDGGVEDAFCFLKTMRFSTGDTGESQSLDFRSEKECKSACLSSCSCTGYVFDDGKCAVWDGEVYNIQQLASGDNRNKVFGVRITKSGKASKIRVWIVVGTSVGFFALLGVVILIFLQLTKRKVGKYKGAAGDLMLFKYKDIRKSTKNFSEKLGRRNMELLDDGDYFPALVADKISKGEEVLMQFLDRKLEGKADSSEVTRACKVACWCIQDNEKNRPSMGLVIQLLEGTTEVGIPPYPWFLRGFTKENEYQSIVDPPSTFCTTSSNT